MDLTVIIPYREREGQLHRLVRVLERVVDDPAVSNTIIVEYAPEQTLSGMRSAAVVFIEADGDFCKAAALNRGAALAQTEGLVFLDADILIPRKMLDVTAAMLDDYDVYRGVSGVEYLNGDDEVYLTNRLIEGGFLAMRYDAWESLGGWPEEYRGYGYEDTAMLNRCSKLLSVAEHPSFFIQHLWHEPHRAEDAEDNRAIWMVEQNMNAEELREWTASETR